MDDEDVKRKERKAKYAQESISQSRLPPRMEKHEQLKKAKDLVEGGYHTL